MNIKHFISIPPIIGASMLVNSVYGSSIGTGSGNIAPVEIISCQATTCPSNTTTLPVLMINPNCLTYGATECYTSGGKTYTFKPCASCPSGYTLKKIAIEHCGLFQEQFMSCECVCSDCTSDSSYTDAGTGYQKKINRNCNCSSGTATCTTTTVYQCAVGYYGSSTNGTSGCTRCPSSGGTYGTTDAAGSKSITNCYIPSGTEFSDTSGIGNYTGKCYYTN